MKRNLIITIIIAFIVVIVLVNFYTSAKTVRKTMNITVSSSAFKDGELIPIKYTCDGDNVSPPLSFALIPDNTNSIALIADDPDAPMGTWVHWVLYNLPADTTKILEAMPKDKTLDNGAKQGANSSNRIGYTGPCPPSGTHRYFFKVYALDKILTLEPGITKEQLLSAMEGHVLSQGQLMGKYARK